MVAARTGTDGTARRSGPGAHTSLEATWRPSASVISRMLDTQRFPLASQASWITKWIAPAISSPVSSRVRCSGDWAA